MRLVILISFLLLAACTDEKSKSDAQKDNQTISECMRTCDGKVGVDYNICETGCASKNPQ
jgi:hypothetical protein